MLPRIQRGRQCLHRGRLNEAAGGTGRSGRDAAGREGAGEWATSWGRGPTPTPHPGHKESRCAGSQRDVGACAGRAGAELGRGPWQVEVTVPHSAPAGGGRREPPRQGEHEEPLSPPQSWDSVSHPGKSLRWSCHRTPPLLCEGRDPPQDSQSPQQRLGGKSLPIV